MLLHTLNKITTRTFIAIGTIGRLELRNLDWFVNEWCARYPSRRHSRSQAVDFFIDRLREQGLEKLEEMIRKDAADAKAMATAAAAATEAARSARGGQADAPDRASAASAAPETELSSVKVKWKKGSEVSKDELAKLLGGLGEDVTDDVVTEMMNLADTDGDGKVNFDEFCKAATS